MSKVSVAYVRQQQAQQGILKEFSQPRGSWFATCSLSDQQVPVGWKKHLTPVGDPVDGNFKYKEGFDVTHPKQSRWLHALVAKQLIIVRDGNTGNDAPESMVNFEKGVWGRLFYVRSFFVDFKGEVELVLEPISEAKRFRLAEE